MPRKDWEGTLLKIVFPANGRESFYSSNLVQRSQFSYEKLISDEAPFIWKLLTQVL